MDLPKYGEPAATSVSSKLSWAQHIRLALAAFSN
jgi:hypothetical protein